MQRPRVCLGVTMFKTAGDGRVVDMEICPVNTHSSKLSLEMYLMDRHLLVDLIDASVSRGGTNFARDCIMKHRKS